MTIISLPFLGLILSLPLKEAECYLTITPLHLHRERRIGSADQLLVRRKSAATDGYVVNNYNSDESNIMSADSSSTPQQEITMPNFAGKVVQWFKKAGDIVEAGEAILAVESSTAGKNGFRINTDIKAPRTGYLAARYKLEGDYVGAKNVLAILVPDQASVSSFTSTMAGTENMSSWWSTPYQPGRSDPFEAESPLGSSNNDVSSVPTSSSNVKSTKSRAYVSDDSFNNDGIAENNIRRRPVTRSRTFEAPGSRRPQSIYENSQWSDSSFGNASSRPSVYASRSTKNSSSLPSQSTLGSIKIGESSPPPRRSSLSSDSINYRQSYSNNRNQQKVIDTQPSPTRSDQQPSEDNDGADFVAFLESRGMADNFNYGQSSQLPSWNRAVSSTPMSSPPLGQPQQKQKQKQPIFNYYYDEDMLRIRSKRKHRPPTKYDIAASTIGGSIWGGSLAMGTMMAYPNVDLPPVILATLFAGLGYVGGKANNDSGYSIRHVFGFGNGLKYGLDNLVTAAQKAVDKTAKAALTFVSTGSTEPPMRISHVTIKTRDIAQSMEFYSLFGFESKTKFLVGEARATWLENTVIGAGRLELVEISFDGTARAFERMRNQELLGYSSLTLDVSELIQQNRLSSLSEFLGYLNEKSFALYNKGLRLAIEPQKREIEGRIYDIASLVDPDGSLLEIQYKLPGRRSPMERSQNSMISTTDQFLRNWDSESMAESKRYSI